VPHRNAARPQAREVSRVEDARTELPAEAPQPLLRHALGLALELARQHEARDRHHAWRRERRHETREPVGIDGHVVVGERDDRSARLAHAGVARDRQPRAGLVDVPDVGHRGDQATRLVGPRCVVDDQDLARTGPRRPQRREAAHERLRSVPRADDDGDIVRGGCGAGRRGGWPDRSLAQRGQRPLTGEHGADVGHGLRVASDLRHRRLEAVREETRAHRRRHPVARQRSDGRDRER
jgi:hypothetical protein